MKDAVDANSVPRLFPIEVGVAAVPAGQTDREVFAALMPELRGLRDKGCSFEQLAGILSKGGLNLQTATVKMWYSELVMAQLELCEKRLLEHIDVLARI